MKIPTLEEALKSSKEFGEMFQGLMNFGGMALTGGEEIKADHHIDLNQITGTARNFILGVAHKQCGCPGIATMIFWKQMFVCGGCNGFITEEEALPFQKEAYDGMLNFGKLKISYFVGLKIEFCVFID